MNEEFLVKGGDSQKKFPAFGPRPCTMLRLARVNIVEFNPGCDLHTILTRSPQQLHGMHPSVLIETFKDELWEKFNLQEGRAFMVGTAPNEPSGIFRHNKIENQRVLNLTSDSITELVTSMGAHNRQQSTFLCHPNTNRDLGRIRDRDGRLLYQTSSTACDPDRFLGWPVEVDNDAPEGELLFGNFRDGYVIHLSPWISILRDPFGQKPNVLFFCTRKVNGNVADATCFKKLTW